ncbi:hypothetical protein ACFQY7_24790 [Actinomadura luteofluorescens]
MLTETVRETHYVVGDWQAAAFATGPPTAPVPRRAWPPPTPPPG